MRREGARFQRCAVGAELRDDPLLEAPVAIATDACNRRYTVTFRISAARVAHEAPPGKGLWEREFRRQMGGADGSRRKKRGAGPLTARSRGSYCRDGRR